MNRNLDSDERILLLPHTVTPLSRVHDGLEQARLVLDARQYRSVDDNDLVRMLEQDPE